MDTANISTKNLEHVKEVLSCGDDVAHHYLKVFKNDAPRAIGAVCANLDNMEWWAHPWNPMWAENQGCDNSSVARNSTSSLPRYEAGPFDDHVVVDEPRNQEEILPMEEYDEYSDVCCDKKEQTTLSRSRGRSRYGLLDDKASADLADNDHSFYKRYGYLVDEFINAVCSNERKTELRRIVADADRVITTDSCLGESNLVNRLSYKHNTQDGRSPLSYAVAKNLKQQVYDLIDLGADVSKMMPQNPTTSNHVPQTALTVAATNTKRDGTEMVRILLSKGASPEELAAVGVDEDKLSRGMLYWIHKARRVGVPSKDALHHLSKLSPMDRIHELDYAVVGEEAAVSVIQEALAGRFGNPQGNRKPLVMLLLGPPGKAIVFSSSCGRWIVQSLIFFLRFKRDI